MKKTIWELMLLTLSSALTAVAVRWFFSVHQLTPGGITGMAIAISSLTGISVDIISLLVSVPLLLISSLVLGTSFGVKTLYVTLLTPFFIRIVPAATISIGVLWSAILGGLLVGISIGLAIYCHCATGGTDVIAMLVHKAKRKISVPAALFALDGFIVLCSWFLSKQIMQSFYSALSLFIIMQTIQFMVRKLN